MTPAQYRGSAAGVQALDSGQAHGLALASADLNRDGAPDVVIGYRDQSKGIVVVRQGNTDAYAPRDSALFGRMQAGYDPPSLVDVAVAHDVPEPVDFLEIGDFNTDGIQDVLTACRGGGLYLLPGDGGGGLGTPQRIPVQGGVTALASGQFGAADGWTDVAVAISASEGDALVIYDGAEGLLSRTAQRFPMTAPASSVAFGGLDGDPFIDVAVASGSVIDIIHGRGRKRSTERPAAMERIDLGFDARGLAVGYFIWNRTASAQIAVLGDGGTVRILQRGQLQTRRFSERELAGRAAARRRQQRSGSDVEAAAQWQPSGADRWTIAREFVAGAAAGLAGAQRLMRSSVSSLETDDVMVFGGGQAGLAVWRDRDDRQNVTAAGGPLAGSSTLDLAGTPGAVLTLPRKLNGVRDVILVQADAPALVAVPLVPPSITVDRTDDPSGAGLTAASACTASANDCSLRGAIQVANANAGTTITLPAGTYTLSINGAGGCVNESVATGNTIGDLEINQSTTITGAGSATTIVRQTGTGGGGFTGDRVMCLNAPITPGAINYVFSGFTVTGGRESSGIGGAGIVGGAKDNTLSLTDVTISNNQDTAPANYSGGGLSMTGGSVSITNSLIGGANAPGADRSDVTLANSAGTSGGGIGYSPGDPNGVTPSAGTLTLVGTTVQRNTAASTAAGGGGADLYTHNLGTGSVSISTSSFSSNQAIGAGNAGSGGAIIVESIGTTIATTTITSNTATNRGGGIYVGGGSLLLDGTSGSVTLSGNTAAIAGSSMSTASAVNVAGTNVTIGGDIEVTTNATWTNNAGSVLAPTNVAIIGGTFVCNNSTMNVGGNFSLFGGASFNAGTGTVVFNGAGAQSISGTLSPTFNNLTVNKSSGVLTLALTTPVVSNLTVTSGTFDLAAFNANRTAPGGTLTVSNGATLKIGGSNSLPTNYSTVSLGATSTVEYAGAGAQTITAVNYGHLTSSSTGGRTLASSGTIGVAGAFTPGTNAYTVTGSTVNFNGGGGQTIPGFQFNNLTSSSSGARTLASSGTIGIAGVFTPGTNAYTVTGSTVQYNGSSLQTLPSTFATYNNLTLNNTAGTTGFASLVSLGLLRVQAGTFTTGGTFNNVQIDAATTLASSAATTIFVAGSWTNNGGFTASTGTVNVNGGSAQAIGGSSATTFNNLIINAASGANLSADATVNGTLTLTSGVFGVGTRILVVNAAVSATGGSVSSASTGSVNYNQASNGQNVAPGAYGNLTFSNFTKTLPNPGVVRIAGTFTTGAAGGHTVTGSTVDFNGTAAQSLPLNFPVYHHLTISNSSGVTFIGDVTINGTLTLNTGALNVGAHIITLANPIAGTVTNLNAGGTSSVVIAGSAAGVNLPSNVTALSNLTLNNANGTTLQANLAVSGALTLTTGILATGANILSLPAAATATRTSGYVNGNLKKTYAAPGSFNYLVGTTNGFSPVAATITAGTGDLTVKATQSPQPNLHAATALQRYWTLSGTGVTATLVFNYLDPTDVAGTEANYRIVKVTGGTPLFFANSCPTTSCVDTAANTVTVSGVSSFSDWTLAENADLSTAKSGPPGAIAGAAAGFDYTVTVTNNGPAANAGGFAVTDVLPAGVSFSAPGSDPACSAVGQTVTCATATGLANGSPRSFVLHVTVSGGVAHGTILANAATAASAGTGDGNSSNNLSNTVNTKVFVSCGGCPFTDSPLTVAATTIKAVHIRELRDRIDVQRIRFGLAPFSWTDPTLTAGSTLIKAQHVVDLRMALDQAYAAHGLTGPQYTDPGLAAGFAIKAVHISEPRSAVVALESS